VEAIRRLRLLGDVLLLIVVMIAVVVAAVLLHVVASQARSINSHAANIAANTHGINVDTDAVHQLNRTNTLAAQILAHAEPLPGQLSTTLDRAHAIDATAGGINSSADSIRGSVGSIDGSARSIEGRADKIARTAGSIDSRVAAIAVSASNINTLAAQILTVSGRINYDVTQINRNLDTTIATARRIRSDTDALVAAGLLSRKEAACIDQEVHVATPADHAGTFCESYHPKGTDDGH
jgi:methyl-accepting chemotaxis protein